MEEQACKNCFYGKKIFAMDECLCKYKGIVDKNYICDKYQYNLFEKRPPKKREIKNYNEKQFNINEK